MPSKRSVFLTNGCVFCLFEHTHGLPGPHLDTFRCFFCESFAIIRPRVCPQVFVFKPKALRKFLRHWVNIEDTKPLLVLAAGLFRYSLRLFGFPIKRPA